MKRTGLPLSETYSPDEKILIDMSKLNFKEKDKELSAIIYLRNANARNIILDFSSCDYERKSKILSLYIKGNFYFREKTLLNMLAEIVAEYLSIEHDTELFTEKERLKYINDNKNMIEEIASIYASTPIFLMAEDKRDDTIAVENAKYIGKNSRYLYDVDNVDDLIRGAIGQPVAYYENLAKEYTFMNGLLNSRSIMPKLLHWVESKPMNKVENMIKMVKKMNKETGEE